jgi:hypothetical protein
MTNKTPKTTNPTLLERNEKALMDKLSPTHTIAIIKETIEKRIPTASQ